MIMKEGEKYLLETCDRLGYDEPESKWIEVTWDGKYLVDKDGISWNEWLNSPKYIHNVEGR